MLAQIIFEQENKGQNLLPVTFMRQLIRLYGDSMQALVPQYLDFSLESLISNQQKLREQFTEAFGQTPFALLEEQTRKNMAAFANALRMMTPFGMAPGRAPEPESGPGDRPDEIDEMKREMDRMRERLEKLAPTGRPANAKKLGDRARRSAPAAAERRAAAPRPAVLAGNRRRASRRSEPRLRSRPIRRRPCSRYGERGRRGCG